MTDKISELGSSTPSGAKKEEKPDNPVFSPASVLALIKAIEIDTPNFGMQFAMILGVPSLRLIQIKELADPSSTSEPGQLAELFFRDWYNCRKKSGKVSDRFKEFLGALTMMEKPLYGEVFQQRYMDETAMKIEDFSAIIAENLARKQSGFPTIW